MKRKEIHFTIDENAQVHLILKNVKGPICKNFVAEFESLGEVLDERRTVEYLEKEDVKGSIKSIRCRQYYMPLRLRGHEQWPVIKN